MKTKSQKSSARNARGGRPQAITADQVVDTALQIGLREMTMSALAGKLGVSIPTIYQTVGDRDEVLRRSLSKFIERIAYPQDSGQHWSEYLREFGEVTFAQLTMKQYIVPRILDAGHLLEADLQVVEVFLTVVVNRGFSIDEGVELYRRLMLVVVGAAASRCRELITIERYGSIEQAMHKGLSIYPPNELPLVRQANTSFLCSETLLQSGIKSLIESVRAERAEK